MNKTRIFVLVALAVTMMASVSAWTAGDEVDIRLHMGANALEAWRTYLEQGGDVERLDKKGDSALMHAVTMRNAALAGLLIKHGADVSVRNAMGQTLLMIAAERSPEMLRLLIDHGMDIEAKNTKPNRYKGFTALHYATHAGNVEQVKILLAASADVNAQTENGETPLFLVCSGVRAPKTDLLETLIEAGADVNRVSAGDNPATPLAAAMSHGRADTAMCLLDAGANIKGMEKLLFTAAHASSVPLMERLVGMGADVHEKLAPMEDTMLICAAALGDIPLARWLIDRGLDVNASTVYGKTAVMMAIDRQHDDMVRFLVENGAKVEDDPNNPNRHYGRPYTADGASPIFGVVQRGDLAMARYLVKHGAWSLDEPEDRIKLLHYAVQSRSLAMCEYVLVLGADVNTRDVMGGTPLHHAAQRVNYDLCMLLLARGADANAKNERGETPLAWASAGMTGELAGKTAKLTNLEPLMRVRVWQLLLEAGAETDVETLLKKRKQTDFFIRYLETSTGHYRDTQKPDSLFLAANEGDEDLAAKLLDAGQDVNARDRNGETPLHFAVRAGNAEMVMFLLDNGARNEASSFLIGTPMHYAAALGHVEILELLLARDPEPDVMMKSEALLWAVATSNDPCVITLVKHGADAGWAGKPVTSSRMPSRHTPFVLALRMQKESYCKLFCRHGFRWEEYAGKSPFTFCYPYDTMTPAEVEILAACEQNLNAQDKDGNTLLHYAIKQYAPQVVRVLIQHGADPTVRNKQKQTPADVSEYSYREPYKRRQMEKLLER